MLNSSEILQNSLSFIRSKIQIMDKLKETPEYIVFMEMAKKIGDAYEKKLLSYDTLKDYDNKEDASLVKIKMDAIPVIKREEGKQDEKIFTPAVDFNIVNHKRVYFFNYDFSFSLMIGEVITAPEFIIPVEMLENNKRITVLLRGTCPIKYTDMQLDTNGTDYYDIDFTNDESIKSVTEKIINDYIEPLAEIYGKGYQLPEDDNIYLNELLANDTRNILMLQAKKREDNRIITPGEVGNFNQIKNQISMQRT